MEQPSSPSPPPPPPPPPFSSFNLSVLLEMSAADDVGEFKRLIEEEGRDMDEISLWYGRRIGCKQMGFEQRTPLMIAAMFGSKNVLAYILKTGRADVNRPSPSDGATALHCAAAGGSAHSDVVVRMLLESSADVNCTDAHGNKARDLISPLRPFGSFKKSSQILLHVDGGIHETYLLPESLGHDIGGGDTTVTVRASNEKKEFPVHISLPDINHAIYSTDEFRMYSFKIKPCSRAYSHDWTECPFVHPGENARRRDPRWFHYSCVPCPEFRKGSCRQGNDCEYAHGIFECWLHPAQYRTRLCKDETGCTRKVCFFAHKPEELRPLYASTGSAIPSPRSFLPGTSLLDMMVSTTPLALGSPSVLAPATSTPPMTPSATSSSMWQNQVSTLPPTLQIPSSRLKTAFHSRNIDLLGLENQRVTEDLSSLSSPSSCNNSISATSAFGTTSTDRNHDINKLNPANLDEIYRSVNQAYLPCLRGSSPDDIVLSPTGIHKQLRSSYPNNLSLSPIRTSTTFRHSSSGIAKAAALSSRSAAFAKRSQSFIERSEASHYSSTASSPTPEISSLQDWRSPDGKLGWGIQREELNKLRKSASFGIRNASSQFHAASSSKVTLDEPDVSWVRGLVKDTPPHKHGFGEQHQEFLPDSGGTEMLLPWVEQLHMDQEQIVA